MKRSVRVLALLMALIILFACPLRVAASSVVVAEAIVIGVAAVVAVGGILCGLGVLPSGDSTAFTSVRDNCISDLTLQGLVVDGLCNAIAVRNELEEVSTYFSQSLVEAVHNWLFSSGVVVSSSVTLPENYSSVFSEAYAIAAAQPYAALVNFKNGTTAIVYAQYPFAVSGNYLVTPDSTQQFKAWDPSYTTAWFANVSRIEMTNVSTVQYFGAGIPAFSTSLNIALGEIVGTDEEIETGYETWVDEGIISIDVGIQFEDDPNDPNDDDNNTKPWWPVHTGNSLPTGTVQEMQSAAQSGQTDLEFDFSGGSGSGSGSGSSGGNGGTGTNVSTSTFMIDLTEFFPFCIPFDVAEFINILCAEPEAPVFHWEIPVPQLNQTFEFDVDLSAWDEVAFLFRKMELLAFIIGLAIVTREKYIRS